ncbi:MAG TPA: non-histone chromosomal MC1 family protein [Candidatus Methylomirabilis sp.]|nr:non-histone chromosomal MC1 family protein [Candidatus Methylomirabilis sp.]
MSGKVTFKQEHRVFTLWNPEDGTEHGNYRARKNGAPVHAALKVATRTTGTKENPLTIRLREKGTTNVFVYLVWKELKPFQEGCRPSWRKKGQTHYYEPHARSIGFEQSDGTSMGKPSGIFRASYLRKLCMQELKEQEEKNRAQQE